MQTFPDLLTGAEDGAVPPTDAADRILRRGRTGLVLLLEAYENACDLQRDKWDFAVEIRTLRLAGLTDSDFRWLICKGYLEQAREVSLPGGEERSFDHGHNRGLTFTKRTCFSLTEDGRPFVSLAERMTPASLPLSNMSNVRENGASTLVPVAARVPKWDSDRQQLRLGSYIIKQYKVRAANQEMILAVFEEEKWPPRIDDPLPPHPAHEPKRRLHDTINSLNRNQKAPLIRFLGDGSGTGVRWELVTPRQDGGHHATNGNGSGNGLA